MEKIHLYFAIYGEICKNVLMLMVIGNIEFHVGKSHGRPFSSGNGEFLSGNQCDSMIRKFCNMVEVHQIFFVAAEKSRGGKGVFPPQETLIMKICLGYGPDFASA